MKLRADGVRHFGLASLAVTVVLVAAFGVNILASGRASAHGDPRQSGSTPARSTYFWGHNVYAPAKTILTGEIGIDAGNADNAFIEPNGNVWETGPDSSAAKHPYIVPNLSHVVALADGGGVFMAISSPTPIKAGTCPNSTVWVWSDYQPATKVTALNGRGVSQIAEAANHRLALTCHGSAYVWGTGNQLGMGPRPSDVLTPTLNGYLTDLTHGTNKGVVITAGSDLSGMLVNGKAYMWGNNRQGQCGCGLRAKSIFYPTPVVQNGVSFTTINSGGDGGGDGQTLAIDSSGKAWCWGANFDGQCGIGTTANVFTPTKVHGLMTVAKVSPGGDFSLFLTGTGQLFGCGSNAKGEVGDNSTMNQLTPVAVLRGIRDMNAGAMHSIAVS